MTYKIVYDKNSCIGAGECATLSSLWKIENDGKASLEGAKEVSSGVFELLIEDDQYTKELAAANSCPVSAIQVVKVD